MATTATSPIVGSLMPRLGSTNSSRGSSPQTNLKQLGMPAEHSSPQPPSSVMSGDSPDVFATKTTSPGSATVTSGLSSFASLAGAILGSAQSEEAARKQKLEKYRKKLKENLVEQEALVNKRIAASVSSAPSQRSVREFEQKIHVLAGKAQKLGRSIAVLEAQIAAPPQHNNHETPVSTTLPSRPSAHSLGKALSISTSNNTPPNPVVTPSGPHQQTEPPKPPEIAAVKQLVQRASSSSSSHSLSAHQTTGSGHGAQGGDKAATMPVPQAQLASRVFKDVKESITSTFRLRPSQTTELAASGPRKFGSADNLPQLNLSNISSSSGSCETSGSGAQMTVPPVQGQLAPQHHQAKSVVSHTSSSQQQQPPASAGAVLATAAMPALVMEKATKGSTHSSHTHTGVTGRPHPTAPLGEKANPGTLPAKLRSSTSFPHFRTQLSFKFPPSGDPDLATSAPSTIPVLDEQVGDDSASQIQPQYSAHHFQTSPYAGVRELSEMKEMKAEMEALRLQLQQLDRHWHENVQSLRVELTDVKYLLHTKPSHDDIHVVTRRCEEYSAAATDAVEHLRGEVINTRSELSRQDQDLDNAIERLRRRVEELDFDAVATRLTLVEAKVSQVSNYVPVGPEPSLKNVAAKLLSVLFALVALFLLLISTAIAMAAPFIRTRIRIIFSAVLALVLAILYHFWLWRLFADEEPLPGLQDQI